MKLRQPQPIAMRVVLGVLCLAHTAHGLHVPRGGGWTRLSAAARPAAGLSFPGSWRRPTVRLAAAETTSEIELEVGLSEEADIRAYFGMVQESGTISYLGLTAIPELDDMMNRGELSQPELAAIWTEAVGASSTTDGQAATEEQFLAVWRGIEDLFEYDDIDEDDEVEAGEQVEVAYTDEAGTEYKPVGKAGTEDAGEEEAEEPIMLDSEALVVEEAEVGVAEEEEEEESPVAATSPEVASSEEEEVVNEAALEDWAEAVATAEADGGVVNKVLVLELPFVAELLEDGELDMDELEAIWAESTGLKAGEEVDEPSFVKFWEAIDDLFEEEEDGGVAGVLDGPDFEVMAEAQPASTQTQTPTTKGTPAGPSAGSDWATVSPDGTMVSKTEVMACPFVAEPLMDGELDSIEVEEIWESTVGEGFMVDQTLFVAFWEAIDDLFEDDEEDEGVPVGAGGSGAAGGVDEGYEAALAALQKLLAPIERAGIDVDEGTARQIDTLCAALEECAPQVNIRDTIEMNDPRLSGEWELVYTCSEMFKFNEGYTGVSKTTPGGGTFESMVQSIETSEFLSDIYGSMKMTEKLKVLTQADLEVEVDATWQLKRRTDLMSASQDQAVLVDVTPQRISYGPVEVTGQRVSVGWKAMRSLNGAKVRFLEPVNPAGSLEAGQLRIMHGSQGRSSVFIFRRM